MRTQMMIGMMLGVALLSRASAQQPATPRPAAGSPPVASKTKAGATVSPPKAEAASDAAPPKQSAAAKSVQATSASAGESSQASAAPRVEAKPEAAKPLTREQAQQQYSEAYAAWKEAQIAVESKAAAIQISKDADKDEQLDVVVRMSRESTAKLEAAVRPALFLYEAEPVEGTLQDFLISATEIYSRRGRVESAAAIASVLVAQGCTNPQVNLIAGLGALEDLDVDMAKKLLERANENRKLPPKLAAAYDRLDEQRAALEYERGVRIREATADDLPRVLFTTTQGEFEIELYENDYPNAVASFLQIVDSKFYDGLPFYQVTPGFGAIGGCTHDDGTGGPGYEIAQEPNAEHPRLPMRGALSLINVGNGACGSKFLLGFSWITTAHLLRTQPVIGRVIRGMDVVSELNWSDTRRKVSLEPDAILSARVVRRRPHDYPVVTTAQLAAERYNAGVKLMQEGKDAEAVAPLVDALKIAPRDRQILDAVALALCQQERFDEASKYLARAVNVDEHSPDAHHHLGKVLAALDRNDQARKHFERAIELKPDYVEARMDLAELLQKAGDTAAATAQYRACLNYGADEKLVNDRLQKLGQAK